MANPKLTTAHARYDFSVDGGAVYVEYYLMAESA
jgi:hypothetical protein